ncbi:uncharacterized protein LOC133723111 [Rosa rugosa]|uniref:uncharacterized protein LOC133723111 n=1 Tax=Rosa rugosa TaxID=74645 RepID=UPI002B40C7A2|nr:uncharacterized protein LOC133723111 [Rosa rugosa]
MFSKRNDDDDEGRNPRSRRAGKEHETNEDPKENILKRFLLSPRGLATTDQSQGKGLTSPSQTADGKGSSRPLTAVALPKSKPTPTGERSSGLMFPALFALAEELYENARPQFEELQQSAVKKEKINFLESPESARVPIMALTEADCFKLRLTIHEA